MMNVSSTWLKSCLKHLPLTHTHTHTHTVHTSPLLSGKTQNWVTSAGGTLGSGSRRCQSRIQGLWRCTCVRTSSLGSISIKVSGLSSSGWTRRAAEGYSPGTATLAVTAGTSLTESHAVVREDLKCHAVTVADSFLLFYFSAYFHYYISF